jgi:hypothetical protein
MLSRGFRFALPALAGLVLAAGGLRAADSPRDSLKAGTLELKSAGALAFGPEGILFVADPQAAAIYAVDTDDTKAAGKDMPKVEAINEKIATVLGTDAKTVKIGDLAVNPLSGNSYLSVAGPKAAVILRVDRGGKISELKLAGIKFAKVTLPNPINDDKKRVDTVTAMEYSKGRLYVAGLSNEEFNSTLRSIPFPFSDADKGTGIKIFHGAHGRLETASPVRTFTVYDIKGETNLLAAYQCTPLVKIPVKDLKPGEKVSGTTIAELGNGNRPLDIIAYSKGGKDYLLITNSARGVMKVTTEGIDSQTPITAKPSTTTAGQKYETIAGLKGVEQLAKLDEAHAIILQRGEGGALNLQTIELP